MLSAIWSARWYLLLGLLSLLVFLVITVPLHFVWHYAEPQLKGLPVKVESVAGTLWDGRFQLSDRMVGTLDGEWQLQPLALLGGALVADIKVEGRDLRGSGELTASPSGELQIHDFDGYVDSALLQPLLRRQKVSLNGELEISALSLSGNLQTRQLADIAGRLVYSGGKTEFPVDRKTINADVPMLVGNLGMDKDKAVLDVVTTDGANLATGFLQPDGWAGVSVRRRFVDVLGQQWPNKATEDTVIFEVSRKIL
ncbi:type II secretion system protein N [Oceanobacter mangrovi]|uniref:type II secretion system protein N n=1 Tax=Oceanobacter mangrovi TaxID=2862510 RepID=UPI001C8DCBC8|nr:type II secretion system protein N [Oceanobacter mangrovi]